MRTLSRVAVVVAGIGLTAVIFHGIRLLAALRLRSRPVPDEIVKAHIELTKRLAPARRHAART